MPLLLGDNKKSMTHIPKILIIFPLYFKIFTFQLINQNLIHFFNPKLTKDKIIATITSAIGVALGNPKFHAITPMSQMI